ncbi:helix-turn-helix domain-containing protein [Actinokineospora iranica]|uniref:Helix-turn-helix domain-containing protein n=1 Tax=Actinokineospora iranica TaxID=1271860 RepID=A0A1G6USE0_9PSEU|nr:helix-turn-helix domain-containing protein [Actinokineospora iranica]SDD44298.1 hypothetical protein SAMN05216174_11172 [Actinokineospora iranica]
MPHPNQDLAAAIADFAYQLRRARRDAGDLPLRQLVRRMGHSTSFSTLHRAFEGKTLPSWAVAEALLVQGCRLSEDTVRGEWLPRWVAVKDLIDPLEPPAGGRADASVVAPPSACPDCGLLVADPDTHREFHAKHIPVPGQRQAGAADKRKRRRLRLA